MIYFWLALTVVSLGLSMAFTFLLVFQIGRDMCDWR